MIPFFRTEYNYDRDEASRETATINKEPTMTQQAFKDDTDINIIIERFGIGYEPPVNARMPLQGDFTDLTDYKDAMNMIRQAQQTFNALPAKVRARFHNEPQEFVDFCSDRNNLDEAIKLGLAKRPELEQDTPTAPAKALAEPPKGA